MKRRGAKEPFVPFDPLSVSIARLSKKQSARACAHEAFKPAAEHVAKSRVKWYVFQPPTV